jgi:hypothetical protein
MKPCNFLKDEDLRKKVLVWWEHLESDRGMRAELSRKVREDDIYQCSGFHALKRALMEYKTYDPALARAASVLSRIRRDRDGENLGMLVGRCTHENRVKRMLRKKGDRLTQDFCTLIKLLKAEAPVVVTADIAYWWEVRYPNRDFLYDFYATYSEKEAANA